MQSPHPALRVVSIIGIILLFSLLTVLTQVGGLVYLASLLTHRFINRKYERRLLRGGIKLASFIILYSITTFLIVPIIAKPFGRVPLPLTQTGHLKPLNFLTCLLNRHYVRPELRRTAMEVAEEMNRQYPGTVVNYLDANFPFINHFPLPPHLSHNDGRKLDLAFFYIDNKTGKSTNQAPSCIGYGISEEPRPGEVNTAGLCGTQGYWQYSLLRKIIPQGSKKDFTFDSTRTKALVNLFAANPLIGKIFIEPHLKNRLLLQSTKIRFHGCRAVRHDDHLHIQL